MAWDMSIGTITQTQLKWSLNTQLTEQEQEDVSMA